MDLVKIGKYIAGKRKELGMTQKQLAEKLNMSDKSVSKWERGICLPDVSVYIELCEILGISMNEFLAGEDISEKDIVQKSEDNLIQITTDSKKKQKNLKGIIAGLCVFAIVGVILIGNILFHKVNQPRNYVTAVDHESVEMKTAELLSGVDGAFLFKYFTEDEYKTLNIYLSEYQSGKLISKKKVADLEHDGASYAKEGIIAVVPDFDEFKVKLIIADDGAKLSTDFPVLENVKNREYYIRSATQLEENSVIQPGTEKGLLALIYGKEEIEGIPVEKIEQGNLGNVNDYVYYLSFQFGK